MNLQQCALLDRGCIAVANALEANRCLMTCVLSENDITQYGGLAWPDTLWSNQSLLVIRHAWVGCYDQYRQFAGDVREQDARLAERIDRAYRKAIEEVAGEFSTEGVEGSPYTLISMSQRRSIADASLKLRGYLSKARAALGLTTS